MARFTNQAQLRYGRSIANSNIAVGEILEVLSAAKEAVRNTYRQNDTITYVISIVNAGTLAYTGLNRDRNNLITKNIKRENGLPHFVAAHFLFFAWK